MDGWMDGQTHRHLLLTPLFHQVASLTLSFLFQFPHLGNVGKLELTCLRVKGQESFVCGVGQ